MDFALVATLTFIIAAWWALKGTNMQARLVRSSWASDENGLIREAVAVWHPGPRWIWRRRYRRAYADIESRLSSDLPALSRLRRLEWELKSWNYLESSVAAAVVATVLSALPTLAALRLW